MYSRLYSYNKSFNSNDDMVVICELYYNDIQPNEFKTTNLHHKLHKLTVYIHNESPCYRCIHPSPPPPNTVNNCSDGGVLGSGFSIIKIIIKRKIILMLTTSLTIIVITYIISIRLRQFLTSLHEKI